MRTVFQSIAAAALLIGAASEDGLASEDLMWADNSANTNFLVANMTVRGNLDASGAFRIEPTCTTRKTFEGPVYAALCYKGATRTNTCGEECTCTDGVWVCCRVRKDFREMDQASRLEYINAVKTVASDPAYKDEYDELITLHHFPEPGLPNTIHSTAEFLGWHRWYLVKIENLLRKVSPCLTLPYWAWEYEGTTPWHSRVWWSGDSWLGKSGPTSSDCLDDGPFRESEFAITPDGQAVTGDTCVKRRLLGSVPTATDVYSNTYRPASEFSTFFNNLNGDHGSIHCAIGGTMCSASAAANAPEFFLHHNNIDRIWAYWQGQTSAHKTACSGAGCMNQVLSSTGGLTHGDVYDNDGIKYSNAYGATKVCVKYTTPHGNYLKFFEAIPRDFWLAESPFWSKVPRANEYSYDAGKEWLTQKGLGYSEDEVDRVYSDAAGTRGKQPVLEPTYLDNELKGILANIPDYYDNDELHLLKDDQRLALFNNAASRDTGVDFKVLQVETEKIQTDVPESARWPVLVQKYCFHFQKQLFTVAGANEITPSVQFMFGSSSTMTNSCGEKCTCRNGRWHCCRIRKSILGMSTADRLKYTTAVLGMSNNPAAGVGNAALKTDYDSLIAKHHTLSGIHSQTQFLPWHRWYILQYENLLRRTTGGKCLTVPYWPWETQTSPWSTVAPKLWHAGAGGFGGASGGGSCVPNGPFTSPGFVTTPTNGNSCLRRGNSGSIPSSADMYALRMGYDETQYAGYYNQMDNYHGLVHVRMGTGGGQMGSITTAANAPEFFLHHCNIDRQWSMWQAKSPLHQAAGTNVGNALTGAPGLIVSDMLDLANHAEVCVKYKHHIIKLDWLHAVMKKLPRTFFQPPGAGDPDGSKGSIWNVARRERLVPGDVVEWTRSGNKQSDTTLDEDIAAVNKAFAFMIDQPVMSSSPKPSEYPAGTKESAYAEFTYEVGLSFDELAAEVGKVDRKLQHELETAFATHFFPHELEQCANGGTLSDEQTNPVEVEEHAQLQTDVSALQAEVKTLNARFGSEMGGMQELMKQVLANQEAAAERCSRGRRGYRATEIP